jgi:hypothetical protein
MIAVFNHIILLILIQIVLFFVVLGFSQLVVLVFFAILIFFAVYLRKSYQLIMMPLSSDIVVLCSLAFSWWNGHVWSRWSFEQRPTKSHTID